MGKGDILKATGNPGFYGHGPLSSSFVVPEKCLLLSLLPLLLPRRRVCKSQTAMTLAATRRLLRSMAMLYVCARAISPSHPESAEAINGAGVASSVRLS